MDDQSLPLTPVTGRPRWLGGLLLTAGVLAVHVLVLRLMGRLWWCKCGFALWTSSAHGSDTSQDLADPYTLTHIIHGMIFYGVLWLVGRRRPVWQRFFVALLIEVAWEIVENTPWSIKHYRAATISSDYFGDSIINSVGDVLACLLGFYLALRFPVIASIGIAVVIEAALLLTIRDNLSLNVLMFIHPIEAIKKWQLGIFDFGMR